MKSSETGTSEKCAAMCRKRTITKIALLRFCVRVPPQYYSRFWLPPKFSLSRFEHCKLSFLSLPLSSSLSLFSLAKTSLLKITLWTREKSTRIVRSVGTAAILSYEHAWGRRSKSWCEGGKRRNRRLIVRPRRTGNKVANVSWVRRSSKLHDTRRLQRVVS